jgi:hypothetical protein
VRGRSTTHEIDVWWEPEVNGTRRQVAFQCKDLARPVDQGEMLKFRAVLDDLDAHPLGVFVARGRYQRGAIMVAAMSNILRLSIDRVGDDEELVVEHTEILGAEIKLRRDDPDRESATGEDDYYGDEVIFYDEDGHVRGNLLQIAFVMLDRLPANLEPATRTRRFREPTFLRDTPSARRRRRDRLHLGEPHDLGDDHTRLLVIGAVRDGALEVVPVSGPRAGRAAIRVESCSAQAWGSIDELVRKPVLAGSRQDLTRCRDRELHVDAGEKGLAEGPMCEPDNPPERHVTSLAGVVIPEHVKLHRFVRIEMRKLALGHRNARGG